MLRPTTKGTMATKCMVTTGGTQDTTATTSTATVDTMDTPNVTTETDTGKGKLRPKPLLLLLLRPLLRLKDATDMDTGPEPLMAWDTTVILVLTTMADSGRGMLKLMPLLRLTTTTMATTTMA